MVIEEFAPAKVNLALHVTGQREDGYHLLDSLVVFAGVGDLIRVEPAAGLSLSVIGPRAEGVPEGPENLVLRAARLLDPGRGARIVLEKHLPTASGIGGGSSDAAAALRALAQLWGVPLPGTDAVTALGADLPVCLQPRLPVRMSGIGETLSEVPPLPPCWLVLVNPGVPVSTPAVFRALPRKDGAPMPEVLPDCADAAELAVFLSGLRNDLQKPARALQPRVGQVLAALEAEPGCLIARMSGSGATCFGLFADRQGAEAAAQAIAAARPEWWSAAAPVLGTGAAEAAAQEILATT